MEPWLRSLHEIRQRGETAAVVTVVTTKGSTPCTVGAKLVVTRSGDFFGTIGGGRLEALALRDAASALESGTSVTHDYPLAASAGQCCGGFVRVFVEVVGDSPRLYLFGAGHVGQALCQTLADTPFVVHLVDEREDWLNKAPSHVVRHAEPWDAFARRASWDARRVYVAVMTHQHDLDEAIVEAMVHKPVRYLGLIGSRAKWNRFLERYEARGYARTTFSSVRCPIGLPTGGKSPKEVAISVAAELLSRLHEP